MPRWNQADWLKNLPPAPREWAGHVHPCGVCSHCGRILVWLPCRGDLIPIYLETWDGSPVVRPRHRVHPRKFFEGGEWWWEDEPGKRYPMPGE